MTSTTNYRPAVNDLVVIDTDDPRAGGVIWKVVKVNRVTADLASHQPEGLPLSRAHLTVLHPALDTAAAPSGAAVPLVKGHPRTLRTQVPGAVVHVTGRPGNWVVLADKFDRINVALLGGDGGRYWRISWRDITPVDVASILK